MSLVKNLTNIFIDFALQFCYNLLVNEGRKIPKIFNAYFYTRKETIMTKREFFEAVIDANFNEELTTEARNYISKMDAANEKKRGKTSKAAAENAVVRKTVFEALTSEPILATELAEKVGLSTNKVVGLMRQLVTDGAVTATKVKVVGKGERTAYALS